MSWWNNGNNGAAGGSGARGAHRNLQVQLAPPAVRMEVDGGNGSDSSSPSSCVSSDSSPSSRSRVLIGACSRCYMYIMVSMKEFPTCPKCKQPYLVDVLHGLANRGGAADEKRDQRK